MRCAKARIVPAVLAVFLTAHAAFSIQVACGLEGIADWGKSLPFKNVMKMCRGWQIVSASSDWDYPHGHLGWTAPGTISDIPLRPDGYPEQIPYNGLKVLTLALVALPPEVYPFGTFTVMFEGTGEVYLGWDAGGPAPSNFSEGHLAPGHGHTLTGTGGTTTFTFDITSAADFFGWYAGAGNSSGILVHINRSEASDPIRNIRIIMPDPSGGTSTVDNFETQPFNPVFLEDHRPFTLYRFMDWGHTNNSDVTSWNQRMLPTTCYAARGALGNAGMAYEDMIDLCNLLRRDMWVCIPHKADANYQRNLAQLIRDRLNSDLKVYVEYSNETWNGLFDQNGYCNSRANALGLGTGSYPSWTKHGVYHVYAAVRIFKIFEEEFGAAANRVVNVISGWHINTDLTGVMLWALNNNTVNPDGITVDAYGTAPYMPFAGDVTTATPLDAIFNYMYSTKLPDIGRNARAQHSLISAAGLDYITYEAGQHVLGNADKQIAWNNDPRMYTLYQAYLDTLGNNGVSLMNQFVAVSSWGVHGCWGAKRYAGQPMSEAHKYRALYDYLVSDGQFDPNEPKYWEQINAIAPAVHVSTAGNTGFGIQRTAGGLGVCAPSGSMPFTVTLFGANGRLIRRARAVGAMHIEVPGAGGVYIATIDAAGEVRSITLQTR
ncbi:MAG: hypothetical protein GF331_07100 [Chitinivibrionales bacterium]|nr:hypothetical protein [Chitinivibrionales bacterium]